MKDIAVYKNVNGENFVILGVFYVLEVKYYAILNILDEIYANNDIIRLPIIQSWNAEQLLGSRLRGWLPLEFFNSVFWSAYHRRKDWFEDKPWRFLDHEFMHVNALLDASYKSVSALTERHNFF